MMQRLHWRDYLPEGTAYHIRRYPIAELGPARGLFGHAHNFCEIFFADGDGLWQNLNGSRIPVPRGTLCRLLPEDWHGMFCDRPEQAAGDLINVALCHETANCDWPQPESERSILVPEAGRQALLLAFRELEEDVERRNAAIAYFLQTACYWWHKPAAESMPRLPDWLQCAVVRARRARTVPDVAEFARWCNRCPAHVGREMRRHCGCGTREFLAGVQLHRAAQLLAEGRTSLKEIAADTGFAHIASFHRAFARRFQCTPQQYRAARNRRIL